MSQELPAPPVVIAALSTIFAVIESPGGATSASTAPDDGLRARARLAALCVWRN